MSSDAVINRDKLLRPVSERLQELKVPPDWYVAVMEWNNEIITDFWTGRAILVVFDDPNHCNPIHFRMV